MSLQTELESIYAQFQQYLDLDTPDQALTMIDQTGLPASASEMFRRLWESPEKKQWMKTELYAALDPTKFIDIRQNGDWVGYYRLSTIAIGMNDNVETKQAIEVLRFHKVNGNWKVYQHVSSASTYAEDDWSNPKIKLDTIITNRTNLQVIPAA